jgi:hypothetical protein
MADEKAQYEISAENDAKAAYMHDHRDSVQMGTGNRRDSIVLNEAADLYGDIQTAESEYSRPNIDH